MFSPACWRPVEYNAIFQPAPVETMPLVNTAVRSSDGSCASRNTPHAGVVVVDYLSLRHLPDQLIARRLGQLRGLLHNLLLGCRRQRNPEVTFQLLQPGEWDPAAVLELRHHRCRSLIVLIRTDSFRLLRCKCLPTGSATHRSSE
jgi:hypothetical protein